MEIRPVVGPHEQEVCFDIFLKASNELGERLGEPAIEPKDVEWMPASLAHFAATDPERLVFAVEGGQPIAFGCAFQRERFWFISELMVLPESQGSGVGRALMDALLPSEPERSSMTLATVVESRQPVATMLYARYGIVPRVPLYWLSELPSRDGLPEMAKGVEAHPLSLEEHLEAIGRLDRDLLGYTRPQDHQMWARDAERASVYLGRDGSIVGYGYRAPDDWISPVAAADESLTAAIVRDLLEDYPGEVRNVTIGIAGTAAGLLPELLRAGMRADEGGAKLLYCSNGRVPPPAYLLYGAYLP